MRSFEISLHLGFPLFDPRGVFWWDGGFEIHALTIGRMVEGQSPGVEHQASGLGCLTSGLCIDGIANNRVTKMQHVDTDLMGAASVQGAENERGIGRDVCCEYFVVSNGGLAGAGVDHSHFQAVDRVASDVGEDVAFGCCWYALDHGEVEFVVGAVGELFDERLMGAVGFCDD